MDDEFPAHPENTPENRLILARYYPDLTDQIYGEMICTHDGLHKAIDALFGSEPPSSNLEPKTSDKPPLTRANSNSNPTSISDNISDNESDADDNSAPRTRGRRKRAAKEPIAKNNKRKSRSSRIVDMDVDGPLNTSNTDNPVAETIPNNNNNTSSRNDNSNNNSKTNSNSNISNSNTSNFPPSNTGPPPSTQTNIKPNTTHTTSNASPLSIDSPIPSIPGRDGPSTNPVWPFMSAFDSTTSPDSKKEKTLRYLNNEWLRVTEIQVRLW